MGPPVCCSDESFLGLEGFSRPWLILCPSWNCSKYFERLREILQRWFRKFRTGGRPSSFFLVLGLVAGLVLVGGPGYLLLFALPIGKSFCYDMTPGGQATYRLFRTER